MTKYAEGFRLLIVQSYAEGQWGLSRLANQYGLDPATVRRWVKCYEQHGWVYLGFIVGALFPSLTGFRPPARLPQPGSTL